MSVFIQVSNGSKWDVLCDALSLTKIHDHRIKLSDLNIFRVKAGLCDYTITEMAVHVAKIERDLA